MKPKIVSVFSGVRGIDFGFEKAGFIKESGYKFDRWLHSVFMQKIL